MGPIYKCKSDYRFPNCFGERGPRRRNISFAGIAGSDKRNRAGTVQGIGGGASDPIIDSGIKTIVKRERQGERADSCSRPGGPC